MIVFTCYNLRDMGFFDFLAHVCTSILIAYLSFTNALATHIEKFLYEPSRETVVEESVVPEENKLTQLIDERSRGSRIIQRILLDHTEYQRAAAIASSRDESFEDALSGVSASEAIQSALVNIYCQYKTEEYIRTTTGTGFFINPKGVILTNAHVAQFLLLKNADEVVKDAECVIRSGNPAVAKYSAELLYISPTWVFENADLITQESPRGTGERDYALLYIAKSLNNTPLPTRFPAIPIHTELLARDTEDKPVLTAGYPAEMLLKNGADAALLPVVASTTVGTLYTFGSNYADIFAVSESPVGEQGASGGPIMIPETKRVIGLIVTKGDEALEGPHSLRALSLSYVDRTIIEETGFSLNDNMLGDLALRGSVFKKAMVPFLAGILEDELAR